MSIVTKKLSWKLLFVLATFLPTTVTLKDYAPCVYPKKECVPYKILEDHWTYQLREYAPGTWITHFSTLGDFEAHHDALLSHIKIMNPDGKPVQPLMPIFTRVTNATHEQMHYMSLWLPHGEYPESQDHQIHQNKNPEINILVRRIQEPTNQSLKYLKEFTNDVGTGHYVEHDYFMLHYGNDRWELGTCQSNWWHRKRSYLWRRRHPDYKHEKSSD